MRRRPSRRAALAAALAAMPAAALLMVLLVWQGGQAAPLVRDVHPNGAVLAVHGLTLQEDRTLVSVSVENRFRERIFLNGQQGTFLVDDFGRRYPLQPPEGNRRLEVLPGRELRADLRFQGAPQPGTRRLHLLVNSQGAVRHGRNTAYPYWRMEVPVPRQPAEPAPRRSAGTSLVRRQAQGVEVEVQSLRRRDGRLSLELAAVNRSGQPVFLNRGHSTVLRDDRGYEYPLDPPANNSELRLGPHGRLDLNLVFRGRPQAEAQAMFLAVNDLNRPGRAAPAMAPRLHLPLPMPEPVSGPAEEDQAAPPPQEPAGGERLAELMGARRVEEGLLVALLTGEIYQGGDQKVSPAGERRLRRLARLIRQEDVSAVKVVGHTDSRGEASYNQTLSLRRAEALAKWLMQRPGLEGVRFQVSGAGERQPAASNQTASGRRQNRRVEVLLRED